MSWKPEIQTNGDDKWYDNATRFATKEEAEAAARDIYCRWTMARNYRAVESTDPVNYQIKDGVITNVAHIGGEPLNES